MSLIKWLGGFLLTLAIVILLAALIVPRVIDPNDYRQKISELVKDKTGRDLVLFGDLSVSVFPWLGIRTQGLMLSQPPQIGDADGPMLEMDAAQLRVKLLPLISKRVEIDTVILEQPMLRIVTLANGFNSFEGLMGEQSQDTQKNSQDDSDNPEAALALVIQGMELSNGRLEWDDRQAKQRYQVNDLNLITGNLIGNALADIELSGTMIDLSKGSTQPQAVQFDLVAKALLDTRSLQMSGKALQGEVEQGVTTAKIDVDNFTYDVDSQMLAMNNISLDAVMDGLSSKSAFSNLEYDVKTELLRLNDITVNAKMQDLTANLDFTHLKYDVKTELLRLDDITVNAKMQDLSAKLDSTNLAFDLKSTNLNLDNLNIDGVYGDRQFTGTTDKTSANLNQQKAQFGTTKLVSGDLTARFDKLVVTQFMNEPSAQGSVTVPSFNAAKLIKEFKIDFVPADSSVLQDVSTQFRFKAGLDNVALSNFKLHLDDSELQGSLSVDNFAKPKIKFELALDDLDLDRYLPETVGEESGSQKEAVSGAEALAVPMALFKDVFANGSIKASKLISGGVEINDINVKVESSPGQVSITPAAKLYDGKLGGSMVFTEQGETSKLHIKNNIDLVNLAKFLQATDVSDQLSGIGTLALDITVTELNGVQSNQGTIKLLAKNGAFKGVDVKKIVEQNYELYKSYKSKAEEQETVTSEKNDETRFAEVLGTFNLNDFALNNKDFKLKGPYFRVAGQGDIDIAAQTMDYLFNVSIPDDISGQVGEALKKLKGFSFPMRCKGSLFEPKCSLDTSILVQALLKQEIEQEKSEYLAKKLGIEEGGKLSTKEILQQAVINKVIKKETKEQTETERYYPEQENSNSTSEESKQQTETERYYPEQADSNSSVENSEAPETDKNSEQNQTEEDPQSIEDQLKDEVKKRILDGLFN